MKMTLKCGFTLKPVRDITRTWFFLITHTNHLISSYNLDNKNLL